MGWKLAIKLLDYKCSNSYGKPKYVNIFDPLKVVGRGILFVKHVKGALSPLIWYE